MDVYSKDHTQYFRANVWTWRPLANYIIATAPDIAVMCRSWHTNDGYGLDADASHVLAAKLQAELDAGHTRAYALAYTSMQLMAENVRCQVCNGTGMRTKPAPGSPDTIPCNVCNGTGECRPASTLYPFSVEKVQEFADFLKSCNGFEIH